MTGVAIIGMAGRFPGAPEVETFWRNLCEGRESIARFGPEDLDGLVPRRLRENPDFVPARGYLDDADKFDAGFFGVNPREAEIMDPQQRLFLELAWAAMEDAGYAPGTVKGLVGVYAGMANNTYYPAYIAGRREIIDSIGEFNTMLANEKDFLATRVSHKLDLTGPSVSLYTGCSTSLVAVAHAFHSLMSFQCDMALAGGVTVAIPQKGGYVPQEGGIESADGHCRPFDAMADGTVFSDGAAIVVLKRLEDATADGDRIDAVIRGVGMNNDGADKVSFAAPSVAGQAQAIIMAQAQADMAPSSIGYVETHGTGTQLGDPIEVEALTQAFREETSRDGFCALGSLKSNVGHMLAAAGVSGLIKSALAVRDGVIPPTLHFNAPNPEIDFERSPFYVNATRCDWPTDLQPRRAAVSSFGIGGTNAHVVLEQAPELEASGPARPVQVLLLSGKTTNALERAEAELKQFLDETPAVNLADAAYTLQVGRQAFPHRLAVLCRGREEAVDRLAGKRSVHRLTGSAAAAGSGIAFMLPGQGSQYDKMGQELYDTEPAFKHVVDRCRDLLASFGHDASGPLAGTAQLDLFMMEYALVKLWEGWGVRPSVLLGHSVGEFTSACLAGVFSLEDGLRLTVEHERVMASVPPGTMLSVLLSAADVEARLSAGVEVAAINGPSLSAVAGPVDSVAAFQATLEKEGVVCRPMASDHAFHSAMMDDSISPMLDIFKGVSMSPPQVPIISTVTGKMLTDKEATDPLYWARHHREPVRFVDAVSELLRGASGVWLEVGPGTQTATFARQSGGRERPVIASLGDTAEAGGECEALAKAVAQIWLAGIDVDWHAYAAGQRRRRVALPTYPFERRRCWLEPAGAPPAGEKIGPLTTVAEGGGRRLMEEPVAERDEADSQVEDELGERVSRRAAKRRAARSRRHSLEETS